MEQSRETSKIRHTRHRTKTNNVEWNSPDKLSILGTQDTGQRQTMRMEQSRETSKIRYTRHKDKNKQ